ncbi:MAG TPA: lytic transglycosylase domain-containing protein, partial [Chloroflexota bacterium]|nr:lytic transglycosylase domain-containing protein [Chloroflexota bacterium]
MGPLRSQVLAPAGSGHGRESSRAEVTARLDAERKRQITTAELVEVVDVSYQANQASRAARLRTDGAVHDDARAAGTEGNTAEEAAETEQSAASGDASVPEEAAAPVPTERPRPRPFRDYAVPVVRTAGVWPFPQNVYRWQPLVEAELNTLRAWRIAHPLVTTELALAVITAESAGDPVAVSHADAVGLMQVLPTTFADMFAEGDPFDPVMNIRAGIRYLSLSLLHHDGDIEWALAGYNAGIRASTDARYGGGELPE